MSVPQTTYSPELLDIDPRELVSHQHNLRQRSDDIEDLVASIQHNGVLMPLIVAFDVQAESFTILAGHRRAAAAVRAGLDTVPCLVRNDLGADLEATHTMIAENVIRRGLSAIEEAKGYAQLAMFGLKVSEIAKATGRTSAQIEAAIGVVDKPVTAAAAVEHDLTIEQAIAISEFEDDKRAVEALTRVAQEEPGRFPHVVESHRRDRRRAARWEEIAKPYRDAGARVIQGYHADAGVWIELLDNGKGKPLTEAQHKKCPGHLVVIPKIWNEDAELPPRLVCDSWEKQGHVRLEHSSKEKDAHPAERAAIRERQEAKRAAWEAAATVRETWLVEFLARKHKADEQVKMLRAASARLVVAAEQGFYVSLDLNRTRRRLGLAEIDLEDPDLAEDASVTGLCDEAKDMDRLVTVLFAASADDIKRDWRGEVDEEGLTWLKLFVSFGYGLAEIEEQIAAAAKPAESEEDPGDDPDEE